jgi:hypothetical protein
MAIQLTAMETNSIPKELHFSTNEEERAGHPKHFVSLIICDTRSSSAYETTKTRAT